MFAELLKIDEAIALVRRSFSRKQGGTKEESGEQIEGGFPNAKSEERKIAKMSFVPPGDIMEAGDMMES